MTQLDLISNRHFFDQFFGDPFTFKHHSDETHYYPVKAYVQENENEVIVDIAVPGYQKDQLSIEYHDKVLSVSGSVEEKSENRFGLKSFKKTLRLSDKVDATQLNASLENGILSIKIPLNAKAEKPQPIQIK